MGFKNLYNFITSILSLVILVNAWPDGSPCLRTTMENMNPLEAVEHQGGLQMTVPPFTIEVDRKCYWRNQPIKLNLRGNTTKDSFKGFAIQPIIYSGPRKGQRSGAFKRLDDNGSWQMQCFRDKDSVTHSHDEKKRQIELYWANDHNEDDYVQFVATVVMSLRVFWVKSVVSQPIPPCRLQQDMNDQWQRDPITLPPPVSSFKKDTFFMFNREQSQSLAESLANVPNQPKSSRSSKNPSMSFFAAPELITTAKPSFLLAEAFRRGEITVTSQTPIAQQQIVVTSAPTFQTPSTDNRRRLSHVIPLAEMDTNRRPQHNRDLVQMQTQSEFLQQQQSLRQPQQLQQQQNQFQQQQSQLQQQQSQLQQQQSQFQQQQLLRQQQIFQQRQMQQLALQRQQSRNFGAQQPMFIQQQNNVFVCQDRDSFRCFGWVSHCANNGIVRSICQRTCRLC